MDGMPIRNEARVDPKAKEKTVTLPKSVADIQRHKVDKLMRNPDKPAYIPEAKKPWKPKAAPEFVRDVMGSSAGAGSGEFHVYRHIRRREYNRIAYLGKEEKTKQLDEEYAQKQQENKIAAEAATAKRRAKRLRKKQAQKAKKMKKEGAESEKQSECSDSVDEDLPVKEDDAEEISFIIGGR